MISDIISTMVNRIVTKFQPTRIVLFGSRARGDEKEFSDVDLLVVMKDVPNKRESAVAIRKLLKDLPISKDIIVSSVDEVAIRQQIVGTIEYEAFLEGKVLYQQNRDHIIREALRWLSHFKRDLNFISELVDISSEPHLICSYSQQSAEKALKAALVYEQIRAPRTHNLDTLRNILPENWPVRNISNNLSDLSKWIIEARYPGDWLEPTTIDAKNARSMATLIYNSIEEEFKRRGFI